MIPEPTLLWNIHQAQLLVAFITAFLAAIEPGFRRGLIQVSQDSQDSLLRLDNALEKEAPQGGGLFSQCGELTPAAPCPALPPCASANPAH